MNKASSVYRIVINGKFLSAPITGVHRVAIELTNALYALQEVKHPSVEGLDIEVLIPYDGIKNAAEILEKKRIIRPLRYIPWEQITLPLRKGDALLLNFCNIGPVFSHNTITMIHDAQVYLSPDSYSLPFRLWYKTIQPIFGRGHRHILTVSEYSKQQISRFNICTPDKISVIPNGADHVLRWPCHDTIVSQLGLKPKQYVVALANTQEHKNIGLLLKAFNTTTLSHLPLVLFGAASKLDFENCGHDIPDNVIFAGKVSNEELKGLYSQALCLAFPSLTEGFGLPPLEAMTLGCPVVAAPCGAIPEACGDAARYEKPDSTSSWVNAIQSLSDHSKERDRLTALGKLRAKSFTWRNSAIKLAYLLKELS